MVFARNKINESQVISIKVTLTAENWKIPDPPLFWFDGCCPKLNWGGWLLLLLLEVLLLPNVDVDVAGEPNVKLLDGVEFAPDPIFKIFYHFIWKL